ncbi:MAG TPA: DinB family protein [Blastocatellia bacterium]|nr:DinB family protein [Blastocatellia bacterium]
MPDPQITILLALIDQAFDHKSWHGTNLRGAIRGMRAADATWRLSPERHNIWEIVIHAAYWKYVVKRRLLSEARGSFPLKGSNWIERPEGGADEAEWKKDVALLNETHRGLREAVAGLSAGDLEYKPAGSKVRNLELITGIASHDLYHAGQIQLLKRELKGGSNQGSEME